VPGIPFELRWAEPPESWDLDAAGGLAIRAGARTDLFLEPAETDDGVRLWSAPRLIGTAAGDWQLSARVRVGSTATFDAAALAVWSTDEAWAKLCLEYSPQGEPTIVSVVTRGVSDDSNGWVIEGDTTWLRISRAGRRYAFHASSDGSDWRFVRQFSLGPEEGAEVGFLAQSPVGEGCTATFDRIRFEARRIADLRDGS
jgi:regulation of enolase protein 1 (concanavalin A-like superfamily)